MIRAHNAEEARQRVAGKGGATLVEIVAVLLVIGVMTAIVIQGSITSNADVMAEAEQLRGHLRFTQALALANNMDSWALVVSASGYSLQKNGAAASIDLPGVGAAQVTFRSGVSAIQGSGVVAFDEWGSPGDANVIITLSDGKHSHSITLIAETGHLS